MRTFKTACILGLLLFFFSYSRAYGFCEYIKGSDYLSKFHIAVCSGDVAAVKKYIEKGININKPVVVYNNSSENRYEFNALHTALWKYNYSENKSTYKEIIKLLVENGINAEYPFRKCHACNKKVVCCGSIEEYRPINLVADPDIVNLLRKGGAKMSSLILTKEKYPFKYYKGNIIVSGAIRFDPYPQVGPECLEMWVDKETSYLIPRVGDSRATWFCLFDDESDETNKALFTKLKIDRKKIETHCFSGYAKIQITNYEQYTGDSEGCDFAKLVEVIETKNYSYKKCSYE